MSKYGFNRDEVRKIICDLIDKDGFHEEHVFYDEAELRPIKTAQVGIVNNLGEQLLSVYMVEIDPSVGYELRLKVSKTNINADGSALFNMIPLFKGKYTLNPSNFAPLAQFGYNVTPEIEGSAKVIADGIEIYGDCTITLNGGFR